MIDLSTRTFFKTCETYVHTSERNTDTSTEQVGEMSEHANKRKHSDHQEAGNNAPKRKKSKYKTRIHPKEAGHSIEDLPSLSPRAGEIDKLSAAEILKSLGLEVNGAGKSAEVWFVGVSEQTGDEEMEVNVTTEVMGTPAGGPDGGKQVQ
ncbi:hypothetical protein Q7P35_001538 [Cladosporium inversicolor]